MGVLRVGWYRSRVWSSRDSHCVALLSFCLLNFSNLKEGFKSPTLICHFLLGIFFLFISFEDTFLDVWEIQSQGSHTHRVWDCDCLEFTETRCITGCGLPHEHEEVYFNSWVERFSLSLGIGTMGQSVSGLVALPGQTRSQALRREAEWVYHPKGPCQMTSLCS